MNNRHLRVKRKSNISNATEAKIMILTNTAAAILQQFGGGTCFDGVSGTVCTGAVPGDKWLLLQVKNTEQTCESQPSDGHNT